MTKIVPTIGRVVWYRPDAQDKLGAMNVYDGQPLKADVVYVWSDNCVNLSVIDHAGHTWSRTSVELVGEGDVMAPGMRFCEWMPYQRGQAAKHDALSPEALASAKLAAGGLAPDIAIRGAV